MHPVEVTVDLECPYPPDELFAWVDDLADYPKWLRMVTRAEPDAAHDDDPGPAWMVDLKGRMGPLTRSKRLRMVRAEFEAPRVAAFERRENDGREHSAWELRATVSEVDGGSSSKLTMELRYSGDLWGSVLERLLSDEIERSRSRLLELLAAAKP